ncbi:MAG: glycosyltransferase family 4 protein [Rhodocyclaceae bacterium]|nr:glycosyltransferase family 4 protein [Rhodocyclaceae bacterium]
MKLLFCVEFYYPSVGGAQEVMRQLAERLCARGHEVTVATTYIDTRDSTTHNGVNIVGFRVSGNQVRGIEGDAEAYRRFVAAADVDVVFIYAAQQWTFDAIWDVLPQLSARKVLVPCGYSGLYLPSYADYFQRLPAILAQMDAVVYHAESYRDIDFAKALGLTNHFVIPNGASGEEFAATIDPSFRASLNIEPSACVLLTVGTVTGLKGHFESVQAFALANFGGRPAALILNGNQPENGGKRLSYWRRFAMLVRGYGAWYAIRHTVKMALLALGWRGGNLQSIDTWVARINAGKHGSKTVIRTDLPRPRLIQAYLQSDLFIFASNVEYSPLVLFEACAAGLPFLSVSVGNAREIAAWTGGGVICEAPVDESGYTRVLPQTFADAIHQLTEDPDRLAELSRQGKAESQRRFNWAHLTQEYEQLFERLVANGPATRETSA